MKKTLIYHFYAQYDFIENVANKAHFWLMDKYFNIFDKAVISIAVDDLSNTDLISKVIVELSKHIKCKNLTFKTIKNTVLCEVETFKNEIVDNIKNLEYSVFFAHNKGYFNVKDKTLDIKKILTWIHSMYFYNFNYMDEVDDFFYNRRPPIKNEYLSVFGTNLICTNESNPKFWDGKATYMGTFYWFNASSINRQISLGKLNLPPVDNRYYAEFFPALLGDIVTNLSSHNNVRLYSSYFDGYNGDWDGYISWYGDSEKFYSEQNVLFNDLNINCYESPIIHIIYIVTNEYVNYYDNFIGTLNYFVKGKNKHLTIVTNKQDFDTTKADLLLGKNNVDVIKTFDLLYPTLNVNKTYIIKQIIKNSKDYDYTFYFDADTIFKEVNDYDWDGFLLDAEKNVLVAKHPLYNLCDTEKIWGTSKDSAIKNLYTKNLTEKDKRSSGYIGDNEYTYVNSALVGGKTTLLLSLCDDVDTEIKHDLKRCYGENIDMTYHIPQYIDENYFNKIHNKVEHGSNEYTSMLAKQYTELYNKNNLPTQTVFAYQKNMKDYKINRQ